MWSSGRFSPKGTYEIFDGRTVYYGLLATAPRTRELQGIVVNDDGVFASHKDLGLAKRYIV